MAALPRDVQNRIDAANAEQERIQQAANPSEAEEGKTDGDAEQSVQGSTELDAGAGGNSGGGSPITDDTPDEQLFARMADEKLAQRYRSLQGQWRSDRNRIQELEARLMLLQQNPQPSAESGPAAEQEPQGTASAYEITDAQREEYGEDFFRVVETVANGIAAQKVADVEKRYQDLQRQTEADNQRRAQEQRQQVYARLDAEVPNWQQLNTDQGFNNWLVGTDDFAGLPRKALLDQAFESNDADRVVRFFKTFADRAAPQAQQAPRPPPQPSPPANTGFRTTIGQGEVPLQSLAGPQTGGANQADSPNQGQFVKESEIAAFYSDVRRGVYRGREADKTKAEHLIHAAVREGRILRGQ